MLTLIRASFFASLTAASFATSSNSVTPAPARRPAGRSTLHAAVSLHLHGCNGRSDDEYQHRLCHEGWQ